jgi:spore cortex formation protein SpoVR/YcgB (stage V sporulation)
MKFENEECIIFFELTLKLFSNVLEICLICSSDIFFKSNVLFNIFISETIEVASKIVFSKNVINCCLSLI